MLDTHKTYNNIYNNQVLEPKYNNTILQKVDLRDSRFFGENKDKNIQIMQLIMISQSQAIIEYSKRG